MCTPTVEGEEIFDAKYPPDTLAPLSDEYDYEAQAGYYGRSEHDLAIVRAANPKCVWSFIEGECGIYASSGFRTVNWQNYFISSVPRPDVEDDFEEYQLVEWDEEDDV